MAPHSLTMTMIGACLLWVGWFGFNAGSILKPPAWLLLPLATPCWLLLLPLSPGCSPNGSCRASPPCWVQPPVLWQIGLPVTPACGWVGIGGALVIGLAAGVVCLWGVNGLKRLLGADDALDVFGVHGVGGMLGAGLTGIFADPALGGVGVYDYVANKVAEYSMSGQVISQLYEMEPRLSGLVWYRSLPYKLVDMTIGLRVTEEKSGKVWIRSTTANRPTTIKKLLASFLS